MDVEEASVPSCDQNSLDKLQILQPLFWAYHEITTRQHWRQHDDRSCRGDKKPWKTSDLLDWQHRGVDWPVGC